MINTKTEEMNPVEKKPLFTEINTEESAAVNGGSYWYYNYYYMWQWTSWWVRY